ncbi:uncharacterized protein G2W53_022625 [Senna tora]|uniref:Uncharacterized protein n=1 Tax=Senna tora TaxID=362788 RepID=A0A834WMA2_9FABA|nr:uncharacterized protein G2W53_022625 [Senna tora]
MAKWEWHTARRSHVVGVSTRKRRIATRRRTRMVTGAAVTAAAATATAIESSYVRNAGHAVGTYDYDHSRCRCNEALMALSRPLL